MNIFDKEFFPTPDPVIARMVGPYAEKLDRATILEPSAGNGAILDYVTQKGADYTYTAKNGAKHTLKGKASAKKTYAIERNPELQMILQQKGFRLVGEDFLTFRPDTHFDLILMNPPFSRGAEHLLHAWDILEGGDIACLLNAETVNNPCDRFRKRLAALIAEHGAAEPLGRCFRTADNPTDVEVVLVRLHKEAAEDPFRIDAGQFAREAMPDFGTMTSESAALEQSSRLDAFIRSWELAKAAAVSYIKARSTLKLYMSAFDDKDGKRYSKDVIALIEKQLQDHPESRAQDVYNLFVEEAKSKAWDMIFNEINLDKYMTSSLREQLRQFQQSQSSMALTKENIMNLIQYIMLNLTDIMDHNVSEVYDLFTSYYSGNTNCEEGWKTNRRYQANRKIIIPYCIDAGYMPSRYGYDKYYSVSSGRYSHLEDIDKAMCWLSGRRYDDLDNIKHYGSDFRTESGPNHTVSAAVTTIRVGDQGWHDSAFFRIKAFKKGTLHLEFKDEGLWAKFNQVVNKEKNLVGNAEP